MKKNILSSMIMAIGLLPIFIKAQGYHKTTGKISFKDNMITAEGKAEFRTPYMGDDVFTMDDQPRISFTDLFSIEGSMLPSVPGADGIWGVINKPGGFIDVKVYAGYSTSIENSTDFFEDDKKAKLLYSAYISKTTADYSSETDAVSRNIKYQLNNLYKLGATSCGGTLSALNGVLTSMSKTQSGFPTISGSSCLAKDAFSSYPVLIDIKISDASLIDVRIPGLKPNLYDYNTYIQNSYQEDNGRHVVVRRQVIPVDLDGMIDVNRIKSDAAEFACKAIFQLVNTDYDRLMKSFSGQIKGFIDWLWNRHTTDKDCVAQPKFGLDNNNAVALNRFKPVDSDEDNKKSGYNRLECATDKLFSLAVKADPSLLKRRDEGEAKIAEYLNKPQPRILTANVIPVVFHILYYTNEQLKYLTKENINLAIEKVNNNFKMLSQNLRMPTKAWNVWKDIASKVNYTLQLANRKNGAPISGLETKQLNKPMLNYDSPDFAMAYTTRLGGFDPYPTDTYLNVYVLPFSGNYDEIPFDGGLTNGFTVTRPTVPAKVPVGVYLNLDIFNADTLAQFPSMEYTFTHEVLHFMGLNHLWDGYNEVAPHNTHPCLGHLSGVDDAPQQKAPRPDRTFTLTTPDMSNVIKVPPTFPLYSCFKEIPGDDVWAKKHSDMFINYMDYNSARGMVTKGQATRINAFMNVERPLLANSAGYQPPSPPPITSKTAVSAQPSFSVPFNEANGNDTPADKKDADINLKSRLYPTIVKGEVKIAFIGPITQYATVTVYDMQGRLIMVTQKTIDGNILSIDLSAKNLIARSYYRLTVTTKEGRFTHTFLYSGN